MATTSALRRSSAAALVGLLLEVPVPGILLPVPARAASDPSPAPSNILLVTIDTIRADHVGAYGYRRDTTPVLDRLAEESLLFERAISPIATTLPSHASLLTSTYPKEHGILANVAFGGNRFIPSPGLRSFAEAAREAGYRTAAFVSAAPLKPETGIGAGFDVFEDPGSPASCVAGETTGRALAWLGAETAEPFFAWIHYYDPHFPYDPPESCAGLFVTGPELEARLAAGGYADSLRHGGVYYRVEDAINAYDGEIRYLDGELGKVLDAVKRRGAWDRTIVIVLGDHGESLGQHGELGHGCIHGEQLRVPLLLRIPGLPPRRLAAPVSIVDVFPTVLGRMDTRAFDGWMRQSSGRDRLATRPVEWVFSQSPEKEKNKHPFAYVLTTKTWKLELEPGGEVRLFDLRKDPWEQTNVRPRHEKIAAKLAEQLLREVARQEAKAATLGEPDRPREEPVDPELLEQLRSLGYVD